MKQLKLFPDEKKFKWPDHRISTPQVSRKAQKHFSSKEEYYKSEEWQVKRAFALHRAGNRCERCGASGVLDVHHLTYENLYNEKPDDLQVLCKKHHKEADRKREHENYLKKSLETYINKKYGEDCDYFDGVEEEFEEWLERKQENDW